MTTPSPLGIGVLGLHEGRTLLKALNLPVPAAVGQATEVVYRARHVRAVAGCDLDPDKLDAARRDLSDLFYTTDYDVMLSRSDVDIVAIYTPDRYHAEHIVRAFEAGKHVICTKPLLNTLEEAPRLRQAAQRTGRKLLVGQSTRFFESFRRQRAAYEAGAIGALELLDAHYNHRMDWYYDKSPWAASETDWAFLGLSHPIDLACWYLGEIAEVSAYGAHSALAQRYNVRSYDMYIVNLRAANGRIGRVMGHYGLHELPSARNSVELVLYGTDGTSLAQYHDMRYLHTGSDGAEIKEDFLYAKRSYYFNNEVHGMHYGEFANYAEYFALALLEDRDYSPNLDEGLATFCVMEAVRRSAQSGGQPVAVAPLLAQTI
ncbi:MAG: Gfo/Idh/MocA family protein [Aggregatilineales bacterium]